MQARQPTQRALRVLLVEDSPDDAELITDELARAGYEVHCVRVEAGAETRDALAGGAWDVVLSDYNLPGFSAQEALKLARARDEDIPFIIVSGCVGDEAAVDMMKAGAVDFVIKDGLVRLVPAVKRALEEAATRRAYRDAQDELRRNEAQLRALACNMPGMVFRLRLARGELQFTFVAEGARPLLDLSPAELRQDAGRMAALMTDEDRRAWSEAVAASGRALSALEWEGRVRVAHGDQKWIAVKAGPRVGEAGEVVWDGIAMDVTAAKTAERRLRLSEDNLRRLSAHVENVKERERARIARELHDDLGGTLTGIKMEVTALANRLMAGDPLRLKVESVDRLLDHAIKSSVRIASDLRPGALDCGITAAIQWQARDFERRTGIACRVSADTEESALGAEASIAVFRIFQETLTNIAKHAGATSVDVALRETDDSLTLEVGDNGCGISHEDRMKAGSFGIRGMLERVRELGGELAISAPDHGGTQVRVRVPLVPTNAEAPEHQYRLL
jgi:signal transduction histidine kinase